jgi:hypothetical protein
MGNCNRVGSVVNGRKAVPKKTDLWRVRTGAAGDETISIGRVWFRYSHTWHCPGSKSVSGAANGRIPAWIACRKRPADASDDVSDEGGEASPWLF